MARGPNRRISRNFICLVGFREETYPEQRIGLAKRRWRKQRRVTSGVKEEGLGRIAGTPAALTRRSWPTLVSEENITVSLHAVILPDDVLP